MPGDRQDTDGRSAGLIGDFTLGRLPATLATGLVLAVVNSLLCIALMTLIFDGSLDEALPIGVGLGLAASAVVAMVIAIGSSFPGMYGGFRTPAQPSSASALLRSRPRSHVPTRSTPCWP